MKKIFLLCTILLFAGGSALWAQNILVTGVVTDANDGQTLPGVSVFVKNTGIITSTDIDGRYAINVPSNASVLVFTSIGFNTQELTVGTRSVINVSLTFDTVSLDEVIITGYGGMKRADYTGAASVVTFEKLDNVPAMNVGAKLAGSTAGVQVASTSGMPGAVESYRIRGMGSINAGNQPLFVVDGIPIQAGDASGFSYAVSGNSLLSSFNSADIETMTVIKDAAAASLYGSRAANGVIVITTKKGKAGKTKFSFSSDAGLTDMAINWRPTLNGPDRYDLLYTSFYNYRISGGGTPDVAETFAKTNADTYGPKPEVGYTDWRKVLLRTGNFQNYRFEMRGGNENTKVYSSFNYANQQGITIQSGYERITGVINLEHKYNKFTFGGSTNLAYIKQLVNSEGTSYSSPIMGIAMTCTPSDYPYNKDGTINVTDGFRAFPSPLANPLNSALLNYDKSNLVRTSTTAFANLEIVKGLTLNQTVNFDFYNTNNYVWWSPESNDGRTAVGVFQRYMINDETLISKTTLGYINSFGKHRVDVLAAFETEGFYEAYTYANSQSYPTEKLYEVSVGAVTRASGSHSASRMISYVSRANYNYDGKYYIGGSFRRDGTSRLASDIRWGNFWSVSGAWRFMQESFFSSFKHILTEGKLRASYGINGTLPSGFNSYLKLYGLGYKYGTSSGMINSSVGNEELTWEKNNALDIGLELTFIQRINLLVDVYNRDTKDLLYGSPLSYTSGFSSYTANIASMNNRGIEVEIKSVNINKPNFSWVTSFNIAHNKNKILYLNEQISSDTSRPFQQYDDGVQARRIGSPYYSWWVYEYAGVDPETGKESYYVNKEGREREITTVASQADRILTGSPSPTVSGGLNNDFYWNGFDLNFTLTFSLGGTFMDRATWLQTNGGANYTFNIAAFNKKEDMWKQPGDKAKLPKYEYGLQTAAQPSTRWLLSTDHLRLKNFSLGYSFPTKWVQSASLDKVRVYVSATNYLTLMKKGMYLDPEGRVDGLMTYETPALKTITFGLQVGF
ncbi:MAG: SusC/RagA family TonB-linked outer membrane protein [Prevotellaceae bacterium]|jgi:TonB-linked SusC/RagA family outer membrane protein|nr:SusC/RagA family TonB-linked outer membrane protein [Prevotellaceae bacterium]